MDPHKSREKAEAGPGTDMDADKASSTRRMQTPQETAVVLYQFHVKNMWSRIQTASVVEGATLGAWYSVWDAHPDRNLIAGGILLIGAVLMWMLSMLILRDSQHISQCEQVGGDLIVRPVRALPLRLSGRRIAFAVVLGLALMNIAIAVATGR